MTENLSCWNKKHQQQLRKTLSVAQHQKDAYVVFDADNTIWKHDLTEALMAWLEIRNVISLENLPPSLLPVSPRSMESVFGYYARLSSTMGHSTSYLWSAQVFQGLTLEMLQQEVKAMMKHSEPMAVTVYTEEDITGVTNFNLLF